MINYGIEQTQQDAKYGWSRVFTAQLFQFSCMLENIKGLRKNFIELTDQKNVDSIGGQSFSPDATHSTYYLTKHINQYPIYGS